MIVVFFVVGVVIRVVIGLVKKVLKVIGMVLGNGFKGIGVKFGFMFCGLIEFFVSFVFNIVE